MALASTRVPPLTPTYLVLSERESAHLPRPLPPLFQHSFWPPVDILGSVGPSAAACSYFLNLGKATGLPILVFMPAGTGATALEERTDAETIEVRWRCPVRIYTRVTHICLVWLLKRPWMWGAEHPCTTEAWGARAVHWLCTGCALVEHGLCATTIRLTVHQAFKLAPAPAYVCLAAVGSSYRS
jgi:hypothetical protein